eukprot:CAMPEP_0197708920 /NCGR_PEP_ID=MMETSP1338-20131121/128197_1 /TAXON_ID=43686 ORGANISM="Pelagodinium beii, Strain RCC1491" /NCGR_SAMPLE_ID=MMETSP1338 /ASSEMBLY_ACC=CAM_ASM_000754 /LENGTH=251 /DNA_ID=CAMNT_0043292851 /DNA_START=56 /DNA_END=811 /DNA_ORIENTATION=+
MQGGLLNAPAMPAMQVLGNCKEVKIKEQVRVIEAITAALGQEVEMANKYKIEDDYGNEIFFAVEQTDFCTRQLKQCLPDCTSWNLDILFQDQKAFQLERPCTATCCCLNRPVMTISDANGTQIGNIEDPCTCCSLRFHARDPSGEELFTVDGGCCQWGLFCPLPCGPCQKVEFQILSPDGDELGEITKKIKCCKWMVADDVDNYKVEFGAVQHPAHKVLLIALAIFMDFKYFNDNSADDDGGLIGALSDGE